MNSLENICKKKLKINENITVPQIVDFLEKNKIYDLRSLFLLNFKKKRVTNLYSKQTGGLFLNEILGFKEIREKDKDCLHIYCVLRNGPYILGYKKYLANEKILRKINLRSCKKTGVKDTFMLNSSLVFLIKKFRRGPTQNEIHFPFE